MSHRVVELDLKKLTAPDFTASILSIDSRLISITCGSSSPIVFSPPPSVANGEFSFTGTIGSLSGRIVATGQARGTIDVPVCGSAAWVAEK